MAQPTNSPRPTVSKSALLEPTSAPDATAAAPAAAEQPKVISAKAPALIAAEKRLADLIASGKRSYLGSITFTTPDPRRTELKKDDEGNMSRLVAQGFVNINPHAPNLLAPVNVYRRAAKDSKGYSIAINFVGVAAGRAFRSYFSAPSGKAGDVTPAAAPLMEIVRAEYDVWSFSKEAALPSASAVAALLEAEKKQHNEAEAVGSVEDI